MVKTRRSNGENGEVDESNEPPVNDVGSVSDEKAANWSQRELRSQYKVTHKIPRWPTSNKYHQRRRRTIKMSRIVFPESDTEPEKGYSKRSRKVRVFFANATEPTARRAARCSRVPRKNYANMENNYDNMHEDSEDKPIQQNVRRSCRQRKLLHHNFNESWITNELKVKGYPDLYGFGAFSSSEESFSADEARGTDKTLALTHPPANTDEDTQLSRQRRTSARFNNNSNKKVNNAIIDSDSNGENENNTTVIEKKPPELAETAGAANDEPMETANDNEEKEEGGEQKVEPQDSESNQGPARSTRNRSRRRLKKDDESGKEGAEKKKRRLFNVQHIQDNTSESELSSDSGSELTLKRQPRRSNRTRQSKPTYVEIAPREPRGRANTFTIRKKPYSLRERKPNMLRRKTIRSQSPSTSTSSSSSDSEDAEDLNVSMKNKSKGRQKTRNMEEKKSRDEKALKEIQPVALDGKVRFSSVGGLEDHIKCLREMVLFPLMYPDVFAKFNTRPAKGVLFHGPPGTGKTLLARALANECSLVGGRKVAFFMRKGADCLKKWVGESERSLKLLFQQANKMKPSIIFFDEIDALAPVRSARQDQVHTSVVGTLLAEMDGLCDRGEVVIIGATNRLDAVDPALRRAGRFDRELHFPPPHSNARRDILHIYTKEWNPRPSEETLEEIAQATTGYGGSDLKALCSEAVLKALRRVYPQVYESEHALIIDTKNVEVTLGDLQAARRSLVAAGARCAPPPAAPLPVSLRPLLEPQLQAASDIMDSIYTHDSAAGPPSPVLLISGECAETHLAPALLARLEGCTVRELSMATLHSVHAFTPEQAVISTFSECRRADRGCVLFVREVSLVWRALGGGGVDTGTGGAGSAGAALLLQLWRTGAAGRGTLLLGATRDPPHTLPSELLELFPPHKQCVYQVREPTMTEVMAFLKPVVTVLPLRPPLVERTETPPPLPRAPPPPPPRESAEETARRKRKEDYKLRELRIFLRDICRKLASNRRFYKFTKPVDLEEVTDYLDIIKQPMDLETMMTKVDQHKYNCAKEFLDDIDLICANALEYNPDRTSSDKQIRHEACSLRDHAHALIEVEMDSDFELECQDIASKRQQEGAAAEDLPDFIYTASNILCNKINVTAQVLDGTAEAKTVAQRHNGDSVESHSAKRKRRKNAWSKGFLAKRARTAPKNCKDNLLMTDEDSKENKPITSTPLPNGDGMMTSSSGSDDDAPLRRPQDDTLHNHIHDSPAKSAEKSPTKAIPKKRSSGHHDVNDTEKVLINKTELDNILCKNAKILRCMGLQRLIDLHAQLTQVVSSYSKTLDRTQLPQEMAAIVDRYVKLAKRSD